MKRAFFNSVVRGLFEFIPATKVLACGGVPECTYTSCVLQGHAHHTCCRNGTPVPVGGIIQNLGDLYDACPPYNLCSRDSCCYSSDFGDC